MPDPVDALVLDLLEWIGPHPRPYAEVIEAWRTSCPRLPVWEEANARGLVLHEHREGVGAFVAVAPAGTALLARHARGSAPVPPAINLRDKLARFDDRWSPKVVAEMNDYQFKLVKLEGEFVWHRHDDTDEVFIVIDGRMAIDFRNGRVDLAPGEMCVVPKGVEHRPVAAGVCEVMLVEPRGVVNTGASGGAYTAPNDVWV